MASSDSSVLAFLPFGLSQTPLPILLLLILVLLRKVWKLSKFVWRFFVRPAKNLKKFGAWAVVTGATDGIGRAYAFQLAKQGLNVFLISRNESKLKDVAKELTSKYPNVKVDILAIDFSDFDEIAQQKVARAVKDLEVGVLINNVGVSYEYPEFFHELTKKTVQDLIRVNIDSVVFLTHIILPQMLARGRGAIVNISSVSSLLSNPLLAAYSGAKSFIDNFSKSLHSEYSSMGIKVQVQNPFFVSTKMAKQRASFLVPSADTFARAAVRFVGQCEEQVLPYWPHAVQLWFYKLLPHKWFTKQVKKLHLSIKARALKKKAQAAKSD